MTEDVARPTTTPAGTAAGTPDPGAGGLPGVLLVWGRRVVVAAVIGFAVLQVVREWDEVSATLRSLPWLHLVLALAAVTAGVLLSPMVWRAALAAMGVGVGVPDAARIYLVGQLGKYVPGSVVAFVLQMELARAAGISRARGLTASLLTAGVAVVTSLLAGLLAVPALAGSRPALLWLFALLPVGLALLHPPALTFVIDKLLALLRHRPLPQHFAGGAIAGATGLTVIAPTSIRMGISGASSRLPIPNAAYSSLPGRGRSLDHASPRLQPPRRRCRSVPTALMNRPGIIKIAGRYRPVNSPGSPLTGAPVRAENGAWSPVDVVFLWSVEAVE